MLRDFLHVGLVFEPLVERGAECLEVVVPECVGPGLVEELREVGDEVCVLARDHQVELGGVHADHLFERLDLDLALGEVGHAADQAAFVEHDVELVAVALLVERVVDDRLEHALFLEAGLLLGALLHDRLDLEELEAVEHDGAGHFGLRELRRLGVAVAVLALLGVERGHEAAADLGADFARVVALHAQRVAVHERALAAAELAVRAAGPDGGVGGLEVLVDDEAAVLDEPALVDEVEVAVLDVLGAAADAEPALLRVDRAQRAFLLFLLQFLHLLGLLVLLGVHFLVVLLLLHDGADFLIEQLEVGLVVERVALFDVHAEALALLHDVAVEDAVVAEVVGLDRLFVGVCVEELVVLLVVLEPVDAVLGHAAVVDALDEREDLEPVAVEQHVARLLVVDFGDQLGLSLDEVVDVRVVDRDEAVPVLEDRVLVDRLLALLVLVFLGARVLPDLLQRGVLDAEAQHQFVEGHFEAGGERDDLVVAVEVDHVVVDHVDAVFKDEVVDFVVGVVGEGDFEVLEEVAVAAGDAAGRHDGDGGELVVRVVEQVLGEGDAAVAVAHHDDAFVDAHLVLQDAVFGQDEEVEVGNLQVQLVALVARHVRREQLLLVHFVALVVPLLQEERECALAQELELTDLGRQLLHGLVDLVADHGFLGVAHDLAQDVAAVALVDGVEVELLEFADGVLVRGHVGDLGVDVEVRAVVALVHGVGEQDDAQRDLLVEHGHQAALLARDLLGLGADALELLLEVLGDEVAEFRLDALPEVVVVVELDLLDLDEVLEHVVAVDHLEAVREGVRRLLLHECEVAQQLVVLVLVRLRDHHLLLVRELLERFLDEAVAQVVDVFVREEERDAEGI